MIIYILLLLLMFLFPMIWIYEYAENSKGKAEQYTFPRYDLERSKSKFLLLSEKFLTVHLDTEDYYP